MFSSSWPQNSPRLFATALLDHDLFGSRVSISHTNRAHCISHLHNRLVYDAKKEEIFNGDFARKNFPVLGFELPTFRPASSFFEATPYTQEIWTGGHFFI